MAIVYRHVRLDTNQVFYIGIGDDKRPYARNGRSKFWMRVVNKTKYRIDIIAKDLSWEKCAEIEKSLIFLYGRRDLNKGTLVNLTDGGEGSLGRKHSKDAINKMREVKLGKLASDETKKKMSVSRTGMKHSKESHIKRVETMKGYSHSIETRKKLGAKNKKLILDFSTGIFYDSCIEASIAFNIKLPTLTAMLNGRNNNKTNLKYI